MSCKFKVGEIVRLKSGGPKMTVSLVEKKYGEDIVTAIWFHGENVCLSRSEFRPSTLEHDTPGWFGQKPQE